MATVTRTPVQPATTRMWLTTSVGATGLFLAVVSTTMVSVALPTIGRDLGASTTDLEWIVDSYVLVYASLLITGGVVGDHRGHKGMFVLGVVAFGLGSLVTGVAPTVGVLLGGRVLQGAGPALLVPGSLTIVRATFTDGRQRAMAIGLWSTASGVAMAVGPALGGLVVDGLGWRWVFLLNVPLAVGLAVLAAQCVPRLPRTAGRARFDWLGAMLSTTGIALLAFAVIEGQDRGWTAGLVLTSFAAGVAVLVAFVLAERSRETPLVDMTLFARPAFAASVVAALVVFFAFVGAIVYFSAYFQQVLGHSPIVTGVDVCAIGVAYALAATLSGRLVGRIGERLPLLVGLVVSGLATLSLLRLGPATGLDAIWWNFAVLGAGIGLCGTPMSTLAMSAVDVPRAGMASAMLNAARQIGQVFGVAVLGALVYSHIPGGGAGVRLDAVARSQFVAGLHDALTVAGLALIGAAVLIAPLVTARPAAPARQ